MVDEALVGILSLVELLANLAHFFRSSIRWPWSWMRVMDLIKVVSFRVHIWVSLVCYVFVLIRVGPSLVLVILMVIVVPAVLSFVPLVISCSTSVSIVRLFSAGLDPIRYQIFNFSLLNSFFPHNVLIVRVRHPNISFFLVDFLHDLVHVFIR